MRNPEYLIDYQGIFRDNAKIETNLLPTRGKIILGFTP